jgi:GT2 family glycosyltransferase
MIRGCICSGVTNVPNSRPMTSQPGAPLISVVIPNFNGADCLGPCLQSLNHQNYSRCEVLIVDNASTDRSLEIVQREAPRAVVLRQSRNLGFAEAVNLGCEAAQGEWIAILNNDTEAAPDWLEECAAAILRHPEASFLACRILDYRRRDFIFSAGDCFLRAGFGYRRGQELRDGIRYRKEIPIFSACGCAALYRKSVLAAHGGMEARFFAYLEDVDLGLRMQAAGARGHYAPAAVVYHLGGNTSGGEFSPLAVRLRTRNALLLLIKSLPARILWRSLPLIAIGQAAWLGRVLAHGRALSYLRGLAGALRLAPAMVRRRRDLRPIWKKSGDSLWRAILASEMLAREDFLQPPPGASRFLAWYFRLF